MPDVFGVWKMYKNKGLPKVLRSSVLTRVKSQPRLNPCIRIPFTSWFPPIQSMIPLMEAILH